MTQLLITLLCLTLSVITFSKVEKVFRLVPIVGVLLAAPFYPFKKVEEVFRLVPIIGFLLTPCMFYGALKLII